MNMRLRRQKNRKPRRRDKNEYSNKQSVSAH